MAHEYYRQTDDRQTGGQTMTYREREREFTFAKNRLKQTGVAKSPMKARHLFKKTAFRHCRRIVASSNNSRCDHKAARQRYVV